MAAELRESARGRRRTERERRSAGARYAAADGGWSLVGVRRSAGSLTNVLIAESRRRLELIGTYGRDVIDRALLPVIGWHINVRAAFWTEDPSVESKDFVWGPNVADHLDFERPCI